MVKCKIPFSSPVSSTKKKDIHRVFFFFLSQWKKDGPGLIGPGPFAFAPLCCQKVEAGRVRDSLPNRIESIRSSGMGASKVHVLSR